MPSTVPALIKRADLARILRCTPQSISARIRRKLLPTPDCKIRGSIGWASSTLQEAEPGLYKVIAQHYQSA